LKIKKYLPYLAGVIIFAVVLVIYLLRSKVTQYNTPVINEGPASSPEVSLPNQKEPTSTSKVELPTGEKSTQELPKEKIAKLGIKLAPNFSLQSLNGGIIRLSDFKGKVIILDFWATWCPPCRAEIPHFVELYKRYKNKGFQMLGVALDNSMDPVENFKEEYNVNYPLLIPNREVVKDYGPIAYIPTTFIISPEGYIYKKYIGYNPESTFESDLKTLLKRK